MSYYRENSEKATYFVSVIKEEYDRLDEINNPNNGGYDPSYILNDEDIEKHYDLRECFGCVGSDLILFALCLKNFKALDIILNEKGDKCYVIQIEKNIEKTVNILIDKTKTIITDENIALSDGIRNPYVKVLLVYLRQFPNRINIIKDKDPLFFDLFTKKFVNVLM